MEKIINYLRAATTYPLTRRRVSLTFSHHLETAFLPEEDGDRILDAAEAEGWSRGETRTAAREASLEGKLARQARKIRELERALKATRSDSADAAKQGRSRVSAEIAVIRDGAKRLAGVGEGLTDPDLLAGLHGNAIRSLARDLRAASDRLADVVQPAIDSLGESAKRIEDAL